MPVAVERDRWNPGVCEPLCALVHFLVLLPCFALDSPAPFPSTLTIDCGPVADSSWESLHLFILDLLTPCTVELG